MNDIDLFIKENMRFLSIKDGETVKCIYQGCKIVPDKYNEGHKTLSYSIKLLDSEKTISWNKNSTKIAIQMRKFNPGDKISITRHATGKYEIKSLGENNSAQENPVRSLHSSVTIYDPAVSNSAGIISSKSDLSNDNQIPF